MGWLIKSSKFEILWKVLETFWGAVLYLKVQLLIVRVIYTTGGHNSSSPYHAHQTLFGYQPRSTRKRPTATAYPSRKKPKKDIPSSHTLFFFPLQTLRLIVYQRITQCSQLMELIKWNYNCSRAVMLWTSWNYNKRFS